MAQKAKKFNIAWLLVVLVIAALLFSGLGGNVAPDQSSNAAKGEVTLTVVQPPVKESGKIQILVEPQGSSANTG